MKKTPQQLRVLEKAYASESNPNNLTVAELSKDLGLTDGQVRGWFKRQRVKTRNGWRVRQSILDTAIDSESESESDHGSQLRLSYKRRSRFASGPGLGSESNSKQSNEPLEAANILGQIASHIDSHVDPLRVKMEERTPTANGKQDKKEMTAKRLRHESCSVASSESDSGQPNEPLVEVNHAGDSDGGDSDGDIKNKMIDMLIKKNERDEAKRQSIMEEFRRLEKSIEDRKKLIDDINKIC